MKNSAKSYRNKIKIMFMVGAVLLMLSAISGVALGSTPLSFGDVFSSFGDNFTSPSGRIFLYVRLPRTIASILCGASLAISGAVIQGVLANRLASPSIIGVNSGAGLAVTVCTALGIYGGWRLSLFAFIGAFAVVMIVSLSARKWGASRGTVILIGVAMNSLLGAISDAVITFFPDIAVMSRDFKVGDFSSVTYEKLIPSAVVMLISFAVLLTLTNELDILTLGDDNAKSLGMNTSLMRTIFLMFSALLAGCAVSLAGLVSFVGLIIPHIVRRLSGGKASHLIPLCALFGGAFVCLCDTLSRMLFAPYEIPVGIIMSFFGAPFFLFILIKGKGGHGRD